MNRAFLATLSTRRARRAGRAMAIGRPGKPPPLPRSTRASMPRARSSGTAARLSRRWRRAAASGSRIAVRLIAAFQAKRSRRWSSRAVRAGGGRSARPTAGRPASRIARTASGSPGRPSMRDGSGSRARSTGLLCSWGRGPFASRSRRRQSGAPRFVRSSAARPVPAPVSRRPSRATVPCVPPFTVRMPDGRGAAGRSQRGYPRTDPIRPPSWISPRHPAPGTRSAPTPAPLGARPIGRCWRSAP